MRLRLFIISILLAGYLYPQGFDWDWFKKSNRINHIIPLVQLDTSSLPPVVYDNFALDFTSATGALGQSLICKRNHFYQFDSRRLMKNFTVSLDIYRKTSSTQGLWSQQYYTGQLSIKAYIENDSAKIAIKDTIYVLFKFNFLNQWHNVKIAFDSTTHTLTGYRNDTLLYTRVTNYPDTLLYSDPAPPTLFCLGTYNIAGQNPFGGYVDNVKIIMNDTLKTYTQFNDGGYTSQPYDSAGWDFWEGQNGPHEYVLGAGFYGEIERTTTPFTPPFIYRSGTRKDLCKYFPLNDSAGTRGLRNRASALASGYARPVCNKMYPKPSDSTYVLIVGEFNCTRDSSHPISHNVTILHNNSFASLNGQGDMNGVETGDFASSGGWMGTTYDSIFIVHSADSGWNIKSTNVIGYTLSTDTPFLIGRAYADSLISYQSDVVWWNDTLWAFSGKSVVGWKGSWTSKNTFTSLIGANSINPAMGIYNGKLWVLISGSGIYERQGGQFVKLATVSDSASVWYGASYYDSQTDRLWLGHPSYCTFLPVFGQSCEYAYQTAWNGINYYQNGTFTSNWWGISHWQKYNVGFVTGVTKWQGEIIAVGSWLKFDGSVTMQHLMMYDDQRGWNAMDYGPQMLPFGITTFKNYDTATGKYYQDLLISGDFPSCAGMWVNHIVGRYSEEHWYDLKPVIESTTPASASIFKKDYPFSWSFVAYSRQAHSLFVETQYKIGINGIGQSFTMPVIDSNLNDIRAGWAHTYSSAFPGDSSSVDANDTIYYYASVTDLVNGSVSVSSTKTTIIKPDPTIPLDSLKLAIDFQNGFGLGKSTYVQKMVSLYVDGTRNGDTLQLGNTSSVASDDPTDSTASGFIYCDGINDGLKTTQNLVLNANYTIIIKQRGYTAGMLFQHSTVSNTSMVYLYGTTGATYSQDCFGATDNFDYHANWSIGGTDSVIAITSKGDLYMNDVLRSDHNYTTTGFNQQILYVASRHFGTLFHKCRLYYIYVYNRILTPAEIGLFN